VSYNPFNKQAIFTEQEAMVAGLYPAAKPFFLIYSKI